ncbi:VOC family protein [Hymenobacter sp. BT523]|uniref:glyoxalase superfamily protein n=1 Tax=Hymenobacter sp. BT523 TaxID=2795725 RepID=UPI0018ED2631|nr:glyoxalase superfamily protein [Hymenobacter sp. BT523]MBJ6110765.1 VOC family protein [Hymenobacter sp. BT523]
MATVKPILRIFDYDKALEFYLNWLGFRIDWEHRPAGSPAYLQVTRADITLHLSEHHGDASPGARVFIDDFEHLASFHKQLLAQPYMYNRPSLETPFYDPTALEMTVVDPFSNRLIFVERG